MVSVHQLLLSPSRHRGSRSAATYVAAMAGNGGTPPRGRLAPPVSFDLRKRWPRATFPQVREPGVLAALRAAQDVAMAVRRGRGERQWSQRALAVAAGVDRDLVIKIEDGTGWPQLSSVVRVLAAVGASVRVEEQP